MSDVSLKQLRCFVAVYSERSFTAAAKRLGLAQSPVSQAVALLEAHLGEPLFLRTSRAVAPTAAAHALYPEAVEIRRRVDALQHLASAAREQDHAPLLRLGAVSSMFASVIPTLATVLDGFTVEFSDGGNADLLLALERGDLDAVLVRDFAPESDHHTIAFQERLCVAVRDEHPLADRTSVGIDTLDGMPLVLFDRERASVAFDLTAGIFLRAGQSLRIAARVSSEQAMLSLVSAGVGIALVPESVALSTWHGVRFLRLDGAEPSYPLGVRVARGDPLGALAPLSDALHGWAADARITP